MELTDPELKALKDPDAEMAKKARADMRDECLRAVAASALGGAVTFSEAVRDLDQRIRDLK